jgi:hypothetical protein
MNKLISLCLALGLVLGALPASAQGTTYARPADVRVLQDDLMNLQDALDAVPTGHARYAEFRDRASRLRDDVLRLRDRMQAERRGDGTYAVTVAEVGAVRDEIRILQEDVDGALNRRYLRTGSARLDTGATFQVRLDTPISSATARREDRVKATVARPVLANGLVVMPVGTVVEGVVTDAQPANRPARGGRLELSFDRVRLPDGTSMDMDTRVVEMREDLGSSETAQRAGIGAALGAILGGVIGNNVDIQRKTTP